MKPLALAFLAAAASCSGPSVVGPTGQDCPVSLAEVSAGCPAAFDGTEEQLPPCQTTLVVVASRTCGDLLELLLPFGLSARECFYDPSTHALVGARVTSDYNEYCGGRSFAESGGRGASCVDTPLTFKHSCVDAGAAD